MQQTDPEGRLVQLFDKPEEVTTALEILAEREMYARLQRSEFLTPTHLAVIHHLYPRVHAHVSHRSTSLRGRVRYRLVQAYLLPPQ